jgi:hypothetical protein
MSDYNHSDRLGYVSDSRPSSPSPHQDTDRARKAAEALFTPKEPIADAPTRDSMGSAQPGRKPRILRAVPEESPSIQAAHGKPTKTPLIEYESARPGKRAVSHLSLVRTWLEYGMTIHQAAEVCGVSVSEIERIVLNR